MLYVLLFLVLMVPIVGVVVWIWWTLRTID
jgi:hypothetical protein